MRVFSDQHVSKEDFDSLKTSVKKQNDDIKTVFSNLDEVKSSILLSKWISIGALSISVVNVVFITYILMTN